jgi:hypothetical protein
MQPERFWHMPARLITAGTRGRGEEFVVNRELAVEFYLDSTWLFHVLLIPRETIARPAFADLGPISGIAATATRVATPWRTADAGMGARRINHGSVRLRYGNRYLGAALWRRGRLVAATRRLPVGPDHARRLHLGEGRLSSPRATRERQTRCPTGSPAGPGGSPSRECWSSTIAGPAGSRSRGIWRLPLIHGGRVHGHLRRCQQPRGSESEGLRAPSDRNLTLCRGGAYAPPSDIRGYPHPRLRVVEAPARRRKQQRPPHACSDGVVPGSVCP